MGDKSLEQRIMAAADRHASLCHYCGEFRDTPEGINQEVRNGSR